VPKAFKIDYLINNMIKEKWTRILLVVCSIVLFIGGISLIWEYYKSEETGWRLLRGVLLVAFAIGLAKLGIQKPRD